MLRRSTPREPFTIVMRPVRPASILNEAPTCRPRRPRRGHGIASHDPV